MKKLSNINNMFCFAYFLIIFSDLFNNITIFGKILNYIDIISVLILFFVFFVRVSKSFNIKKYIPYFIFFLVAFISSFYCNNMAVLKLPCLLLAFYGNDIDSRKFIKFDLKVRTILVLIIMVLYSFGITDGYSGEIRNGFLRQSFGAGHPNSFACYLLIIVLDISFLAKTKQERIFSFAISFIIALFIHLFVGSRTSEYLIIVANLIMILKNQIFKLSKFKVFPFLFFIIGILTYYICMKYNSSNFLYYSIDNLLSKRIYYSSEIIRQYPLNLFGNNIVSYLILDNAYLNLIIRYGLLMFFMFSYFFYKTMKKIIKNKEVELMINLFLLMLFGFAETPLIVPAKNPYLLGFVGFNSKEEECV
jgi:hypothetical protein